ncbi:ornithine cyclodeaminase family protein [Streptomyces puniciscabiei]
MTRYLSAEDIAATATPELALRAARATFAMQAAGLAVMPPRIDVPSSRGFLRVMPAVLGERMGLKMMTLVRGVGTRYVVALYDAATGELLALLDASELTRLRTAACTAVAASLMVHEPPTEIGLIGTGFEAAGHLHALAALWPLARVHVFSPSVERRTAFAERLGAVLDLDIRPAASVDEVTENAATLVLATKSSEPVLDGTTPPAGAVLLSIGSTRPDLRELDLAALRRTGTLLVDDVAQVEAESGDVIEAVGEGVLDTERMVPVSRALTEPSVLVRGEDRDLLVFKSVGTAIQDLRLAEEIRRAAEERGLGRELGELAPLKPFAATTASVQQ